MTSKWPIPAVVLGTSGDALGVARALGRMGVRVVGVTQNNKKDFGCRRLHGVYKQTGSSQKD